jgi:hypothetical protein
MKISGVILGVLPSKSNSRELGRVRRKNTGLRFGEKAYRPIIMKSAAARQFVDTALRQINFRQRVGLIVDVALTAYVYYPNRRHDVMRTAVIMQKWR